MLEAYKYTFSKPGALTGPINYYRCMLKNQSKGARNASAVSNGMPPKITIPTLLIWVRGGGGERRGEKGKMEERRGGGGGGSWRKEGWGRKEGEGKGVGKKEGWREGVG